MNNTKFKIGDVVMLKSGSVPMTIHSINANVVECAWCDGIHNKSVKYHMDVLIEYYDSMDVLFDELDKLDD
jgi:uncharacterized protein YodC (DUF2158 family)